MKSFTWIIAGGLVLATMACTPDRWETPAKTSNTAIAPDIRQCPDWSSDPVKNYENEDFSNLGCSTTHNLYVQLRDKNDYRRGSGKSKIDATRDGVVIQGYMGGSSASGSSSAAASSAASSTSR
jgi:type IV pilus biogenesis protein CpaD/CtpE